MLSAAPLILTLLTSTPPSVGVIEGRVTSVGPSGLVVVYVADAPVTKSMAPHRQQIAQHHTAFVPDALVMQVGDEIEFPNYDKTHHNAFSDTPGNEFDLGLYRSGTSKTVTMRTPGEVDVYCNVHAPMHARVLVVPSPHFVVADAEGVFRLANVPVGRHTVVMWSSVHEPVRREVEVQAEAATLVDVRLVDLRPARSHMNKDGEPYAQGGYLRR